VYAKLKAFANDFKQTPVDRSRMFAKIRSGGNRSTEWRLRGALIRAGIRGWRVRPGDVPGKPDFFFEKECMAVFVDGCYWHGCPTCGHIPKKNSRFWREKFALSKRRDRAVVLQLRRSRCGVVRIWEHELTENVQSCLDKVVSARRKKSRQ